MVTRQHCHHTVILCLIPSGQNVEQLWETIFTSPWSLRTGDGKGQHDQMQNNGSRAAKRTVWYVGVSRNYAFSHCMSFEASGQTRGIFTCHKFAGHYPAVDTKEPVVDCSNEAFNYHIAYTSRTRCLISDYGHVHTLALEVR